MGQRFGYTVGPSSGGGQQFVETYVPPGANPPTTFDYDLTAANDAVNYDLLTDLTAHGYAGQDNKNIRVTVGYILGSVNYVTPSLTVGAVDAAAFPAGCQILVVVPNSSALIGRGGEGGAGGGFGSPGGGAYPGGTALKVRRPIFLQNLGYIYGGGGGGGGGGKGGVATTSAPGAMASAGGGGGGGAGYLGGNGGFSFGHSGGAGGDEGPLGTSGNCGIGGAATDDSGVGGNGGDYGQAGQNGTDGAATTGGAGAAGGAAIDGIANVTWVGAQGHIAGAMI